jgi:hypothetical protein
LEEVKNPRKNPFSMLSFTISGKNRNDMPYWNMLVDVLGAYEIERILKLPEVVKRVKRALKANQAYRKALLAHTEERAGVTLTDFRQYRRPPSGSRFLVYALYPRCRYNVKVRHDRNDQTRIVISIGGNIFFEERLPINVGAIAAAYGGGGHHGAGAFSVPQDEYTEAIVDVLEKLNGTE